MTEKSKLTEELMREYGLSDEPAAPAIDASGKPIEVVVPATTGGGNPFIDLKRRQEEEAKKQPPKNEFERNPEITGMGGLLGAMAQYKGAGQNLFRPDPNLFIATNPNMPNAPRGGVMAPVVPATDVEHVLQSGQEPRPQVTGRQKESGHNWESNRQSLAQQMGLSQPGASNVVVQSGPMYPTKSGVGIPQNVAIEMEQELQAKQAAEAEQRRQLLAKQAAEQQRVDQQKARRAKVIGAAKGTGQIGQGFVGGALAAPALYEYTRDALKKDAKKPADTTQLASGVGGLMMALGKGKLGTLGALAQIPYVVKHRDELARSQMLSDIVPDTMRMGMTGSEMYEPAGTMPTRKP
jgi:hypothetical protein